MQQPKFRGTGVALATPFEEQRVDYPALERLIEYVIEGGVDYLVSLGTTGEAITLSRRECREVLDFTRRQVDGRVPLVAGLFGSNYTAKLVESLRQYDLEGFDAIMSSSPAYSKPPQEGIFRHYMAIAEVTPVPVIIYNVPGRTASNVQASTVIRLAEASDKFVAVKEASGDLYQGMQLLKRRPENFLVLSGDDPTALPLIAAGADGVISVIANAYPAHFSEMVRATLQGEFAVARRLNEELLDIHPWLYCEGNPTGIKAALEILGLCRREVRIPLVPLTDASYQHLRTAMEQVPEFVLR